MLSGADVYRIGSLRQKVIMRWPVSGSERFIPVNLPSHSFEIRNLAIAPEAQLLVWRTQF